MTQKILTAENGKVITIGGKVATKKSGVPNCPCCRCPVSFGASVNLTNVTKCSCFDEPGTGAFVDVVSLDVEGFYQSDPGEGTWEQHADQPNTLCQFTSQWFGGVSGTVERHSSSDCTDHDPDIRNVEDLRFRIQIYKERRNAHWRAYELEVVVRSFDSPTPGPSIWSMFFWEQGPDDVLDTSIAHTHNCGDRGGRFDRMLYTEDATAEFSLISP